MSKALGAAGMSFVGSTICYAFMQSVGMVNDHVAGCFRRAVVAGDHFHNISDRRP
jgi:DNA-3-methyladenine glycosylase I